MCLHPFPPRLGNLQACRRCEIMHMSTHTVNGSTTNKLDVECITELTWLTTDSLKELHTYIDLRVLGMNYLNTTPVYNTTEYAGGDKQTQPTHKITLRPESHGPDWPCLPRPPNPAGSVKLWLHTGSTLLLLLPLPPHHRLLPVRDVPRQLL